MWMMVFTFPVLVLFMLYAKFTLWHRAYWVLVVEEGWSAEKTESWLSVILGIVWFFLIELWLKF